MGVKVKGFDDFSKKLKQMQKSAQDLEKGSSVGFGDLFNENFMQKNTQFQNIDEFFEKSSFDTTTQEDFDKIDENELNEYVQLNTKFSDWEEMKATATEEWVAKKLGF